MDDIKFIFFDFDGTLADTMEAGIKITNKIAKQLNLEPLDETKLDLYRNLEPNEFLKLMNIPLIKIPFLAGMYHIEFNKIIHTLKPFDGIPQMLDKLSQKYNLGILSSNSVENIEKFLAANNLRQYFKFIHSQPHIFGKSSSIKKLMRRNRLKRKQVIYIGDEVRDIQAAKQAKIPVIAVTWGLNSEKLIQKYNPDYIAHTPDNVLDILGAQ